jgi:hypothetical protein
VTAVTSVAGFNESNAVGGTHVLSMSMTDGVGNNRANTTTSAANGGAGTETISIDRTNPVLQVPGCTWPNDATAPPPGSAPCVADGNIVNTGALTANSISFAAIDAPGSAGVVPSGFLSLAGNPLLTQIQRVTATSSNSWWCPATVTFNSTGTGCASWVTGQRFQGPLTQSFAGFGATNAYYTTTSTVDDQAGNQAPDVSSRFLYDVTLPVTGGISFPGFVTGGVSTQFSAPVNDNIAVASGIFNLTYAGFAQAFQFPAQTTGVAFGGFLTSTTVQLNTPLMRLIQQPAGGTCAAPGPIPGAGALANIGVSLVATDLANNTSAPAQTGTVTAGQINTTPALTSYSASTMTSWLVSSIATCAPGTTLVSRALPGVTAANPTSVTVSAVAVGPTGTFNNPFTSRVDFWVQNAAGPGTWRYIGTAFTPAVTDNLVNRFWTFSVVWTPDAYTAPFASAPGAYPVNIIAIGVNIAGDALATAAHTGFSVTNP